MDVNARGRMKFERSGCTTCGLEIPSADSAARWHIIVYGIGASAVARRKAMCGELK